ncbi:choline dehydrogenase [Phenylobacterium sp.]|uniref:choline dehydrogenase n=1 Tax=Phenylobacterium sp. TaxID=1871053 RepID=UPI00301DF652
MDRYDIIIVGAGSAGSVLANRLSADGQRRVLLLEAGGRDGSIFVKMPAGTFSLATKGRYNWGFWSEPEPELGGRRIFFPRGKGLGGSSLINGMIYIRGNAGDYDQWRQMGLAGWSYADVLPYFKRAEGLIGPGEDLFHGRSGPLSVSQAKTRNTVYESFVQAGEQAGHPVNADFNGSDQEGFGRYHLTIRDGERWSASRAYLRPIAGVRPNLTIQSRARATRILVEGGRAVGVEYVVGRSTERRTAYADAEVVLSTGAVQSPQLLLLSGIGPAEEVRAAGVPVVHDLPGVGKNLQDHIAVRLNWEVPGIPTAYTYSKGLAKLMTGLDYLLRKQGPGRQNFLETGAFIRTRPELDRPDVQLHNALAVVQTVGESNDRGGFTISLCPLRPESRGEITLRSNDPFEDPVIRGNYLTAPRDRQTMLDAVRMVREVAAQPALKSICTGELHPGPAVQSDAEIDAWIRATCGSQFHPVGTCRMGPTGDPSAVVDGQLRVQGLSGLRVIDASVMPTLVGGNTNAPSIMIGEKGADLILGQSLPPDEAADGARRGRRELRAA